MLYVKMRDNFLSGWGKAEGKEAILIMECGSEEDSKIVKENAENRDDMKNIEILLDIPEYIHKDEYFVEIKDKSDYSNWYKKGFFKESEEV